MCITEIAGGIGLNPNTRAWQGIGFGTDGEKFIVKQKAGNSGWGVKLLGFDYEGFSCPSETGNALKIFDEDTLGCNSPYGYGVFKLNLSNNRFLATYAVGYIDGKDTDGNSPSISIGKCSVI